MPEKLDRLQERLPRARGDEPLSVIEEIDRAMTRRPTGGAGPRGNDRRIRYFDYGTRSRPLTSSSR